MCLGWPSGNRYGRRWPLNGAPKYSKRERQHFSAPVRSGRLTVSHFYNAQNAFSLHQTATTTTNRLVGYWLRCEESVTFSICKNIESDFCWKRGVVGRFFDLCSGETVTVRTPFLMHYCWTLLRPAINCLYYSAWRHCTLSLRLSCLYHTSVLNQ